MTCIHINHMTIPAGIDGQQYFDDFFMEGENFFNASNFHMERTYGSKACALVDPSPPEEGDFVDYLDETHQQFKTPDVGYMCAPRDKDITKQLIGRKGFAFIKITEESGVDFIWHDRKTNLIRIDGPSHCIPVAMDKIRRRIAYFIRRARRENRHVFKNEWDHPMPVQRH